MPAGIKEDVMEALVPLLEEGLKPKQIERRLAEDPHGLQLKRSTITVYGTEWRRRKGTSNPVPPQFQKAEEKVETEVQAGVGLEQGAADELKKFCAEFPGQCRTMIAEEMAKLGEKLQAASPEGAVSVSDLERVVKEATASLTPPAAELPETGERIDRLEAEVADIHKAGEEDAPTEKEMMVIPPVTYIQWLRGHIETCPTCLGMGDQLTQPLQGILAALTAEAKPEAEDEGRSEDGAERGGDPGAGNPEGSPGEDQRGGRGGREGTAEEVRSEEPGGEKPRGDRPTAGPEEPGRPDGERPTVTDPVSSESGEPATGEPTPEPTPEPTGEPTEWRWGRGRG